MNAGDWRERYRRWWDERFDRLEDYLRELKKENHADGFKRQSSNGHRGPGDSRQPPAERAP
jgi:hypothetical protein